MDTLLDDSDFLPVFYKAYSELFIECAFHQQSHRFYKLVREAEKTLHALHYDFELVNALDALEACGELVQIDWLLTSLSYYENNKEYWFS